MPRSSWPPCHRALGTVLNIARSREKVCIHQTDTRLKREGVAHLGMFLFFTGELLALETDDYLERLWTVYELATFVMLHPEGRIVMLNVNLPPIVLVGSMILTILALVSFALQSTTMNRFLLVAATLSTYAGVIIQLPLLIFIVQVPCVLFIVIFMRRTAVEQERRAANLFHHFGIGRAGCTKEADRGPVLANITSLLHQMGTHDDVEDATTTFDNLVRRAVPEAVKRSVGPSGIPYKYVLIFSLTVLGQGFDAVGSEIAAGSALQEAFPRCWYWFAWHFGWVPTCVATASLLTRRCLHLHGFSGKGYVVVTWIVVVLVAFGVQGTLSNLRARAVGSHVFSLIFVVVTLVMVLFACMILQPRNRTRRSRHTTNDDASVEMAARLCQPIHFSRECSSEGSAGSTAQSTSSMCVKVTAATLGRIRDVDAHSTSQGSTRPVVRTSL